MNNVGQLTVATGTPEERVINFKSLSSILFPDRKLIQFAVLENNEGYFISSKNFLNPELDIQNWVGGETLTAIISAILLAQQNNAIDINALFEEFSEET